MAQAWNGFSSVVLEDIIIAIFVTRDGAAAPYTYPAWRANWGCVIQEIEIEGVPTRFVQAPASWVVPLVECMNGGGCSGGALAVCQSVQGYGGTA